MPAVVRLQAECPFTCQSDRLSDQLCPSLDRLSDHFAKHGVVRLQAEPRQMRALWRSATVGVSRMLDTMKSLQDSSGQREHAGSVWANARLLDSHLMQARRASLERQEL